MRDKEFAVAHKALVESTQDKTTIPESFSLKGDGVLYGKKGKLHTLVIPVKLPQVDIDYANLKVLGSGRVLHARDVKVDSWLRNYHNWRVSASGYTIPNDASPLWGDSYINGKDTGGTIRSHSTYPFVIKHSQYCENVSGYGVWKTVSANGVVIGTDDTGVDEDQYALGSQIPHGVGSGQIYYAESPAPFEYELDESRNFLRQHTRYFDNFNSDGTSITVAEMGIIAKLCMRLTEYYFLVARDVIDPPLEIPFRAQAAFTFYFSQSMPLGSPLRNYHNAVASQHMSIRCTDSTFEDGKISLLNTSNTVVYGTLSWPNFYALTYYYQVFLGYHVAGYGMMGGAGVDTHGIQVGAGNTSVTFNDYILDSLIANGAGGGQLQYSVGETPARSWDAGSDTLTTQHARTFTNADVSSIDVLESGVVAKVGLNESPYNYLALFLRDVFSAVEIASTESLRVIYQLQEVY